MSGLVLPWPHRRQQLEVFEVLVASSLHPSRSSRRTCLSAFAHDTQDISMVHLLLVMVLVSDAEDLQVQLLAPRRMASMVVRVGSQVRLRCFQQVVEEVLEPLCQDLGVDWAARHRGEVDRVDTCDLECAVDALRDILGTRSPWAIRRESLGLDQVVCNVAYVFGCWFGPLDCRQI